MSTDKFIVNEIVKVNRQMVLGIHEQYDKIDSVFGRRIAVIEGKVDAIEKELGVLGKELREQYYSLGRKLDLIELQLVKQNNKE
ncbi:hypothetical protein QNH39_06985 [Neobacillus novalis]|uniref:Uncharacterized protein n=1 Tax=Neobacillus novalis TaxID=220687 RepID=A0AA95SC52_9BACI|nr:hypothetical protein [Neobacillus novalis]WHY87567.1 hypothetical protein QNH39_06985 [Neobacillus novalis]